MGIILHGFTEAQKLGRANFYAAKTKKRFEKGQEV